MLERLAEAAALEPTLKRFGKRVSATIIIGFGEDEFLVDIADGRVTDIRRRSLPLESGVFAIRAPVEVWAEHWRPHPARGYNDLFTLFSYGHATIDGDLLPFMRNLLFFKLLLAAPRALNRSG